MKVLIALITCKAYAHKLGYQQQTWIPRAIAAGWDVQVFDGERLKVDDGYGGLPSKTKALCKWALENGYTNVLKIDDDAYMWVERFKALEYDYAGHIAPANDAGCPQLGVSNYPKGHFPHNYASGGAYWISEKSMRIIAQAEINDWAEDRWVGNTLANAGIQLRHLADYGYSTMGTVMDKNYTVLAQIQGDGILRVEKGIEPGYKPPIPPRPPAPIPVPGQVPVQAPPTVVYKGQRHQRIVQAHRIIDRRRQR